MDFEARNVVKPLSQRPTNLVNEIVQGKEKEENHAWHLNNPELRGNRERRLGKFFVLLGFIACPCHLPALLLVFIAILSGSTAFGLFFSGWMALVIILSTIIFIGASLSGLYFLKRADGLISANCPNCSRP